MVLTPSNNILTTAEIVRLVKLFVSQGVTKVRLTGGEPLLRKDLIDVVSECISSLLSLHE